MEKKNIINPFAQKGRIITGDAFIGRFENLRSVASNVTDQAMPNNLAIIGYPRIGKSSLAKQAIIEQKAELIKEKKIPIWIDFSKFSSRDAFFKYIVRYSFDELKKLDVLLDAQTYVSDVLQQENWDDLTYYIEKYFEYTISEGYYFIFILDEFDEARSIFKGNAEAFKMLRELAYDSNKFGVAWVTTSRRSIKEIEVKSDCSSSNFNLIMTKEYLSCYNQEELQAYFQLYENIGVQLTEEQKSKIVFYCGEHPFLLASLGFEIVEKFRHNEPIEDIDIVFGKIRISILDYYEQLIDLLKEDKTFEKMLQILFGPVINVIDDDITELRDTYGLLKDLPLPDGDKGLMAFSQHFQEYLQNLGRKIDFFLCFFQKMQSRRIGQFGVQESRVCCSPKNQRIFVFQILQSGNGIAQKFEGGIKSREFGIGSRRKITLGIVLNNVFLFVHIIDTDSCKIFFVLLDFEDTIHKNGFSFYVVFWFARRQNFDYRVGFDYRIFFGYFGSFLGFNHRFRGRTGKRKGK